MNIIIVFMRPERRDVSLKILFLQHSSNFGGAPRSLLQIVKKFELENASCAVLFLRRGPVMQEYLSLSSKIFSGKYLLPFHGSEVSGMNVKLAVRNIFGLFGLPYCYFRYLRGWDVVYLNSSCLCFYGAMVRLFSPKTRIICHIREPLLDNMWGAIIRFVLKHTADYFIAISRNEMDNLKLDCPGEVVYNYVHSEDYVVDKGNSLHRLEASDAPDKVFVGYFARVDLKNGIADFIEIARRFENDNTYQFCVYGHTGDEIKVIQELIDGAPNNCSIYPMVSNVTDNLCDLDILLVPFKSPHFSRSVIEGAMLGVPSIIYDVRSLNETVRDGVTGFVVPQGDISAMEAKLKQLKKDPQLRADMSKAAKSFAKELFSEQNYRRIEYAILEDTASLR